MEVTLIPNDPAPVINWDIPNVLQMIRIDDGVILFINEVTMDTEADFMAMCILNTSASNDAYIPGRLYPGTDKELVILYDGQVILNN